MFFKNHLPQVNKIRENVIRPKSFVFTGWKLNYFEMDVDEIRDFMREKWSLLRKILDEYSSTDYSMHMEFKMYGGNHSDYGKGYLHFPYRNIHFPFNEKQLKLIFPVPLFSLYLWFKCLNQSKMVEK